MPAAVRLGPSLRLEMGYVRAHALCYRAAVNRLLQSVPSTRLGIAFMLLAMLMFALNDTMASISKWQKRPKTRSNIWHLTKS